MNAFLAGAFVFIVIVAVLLAVHGAFCWLDSSPHVDSTSGSSAFRPDDE